MSGGDRPFDARLVDGLRGLPVVERVEVGLLATAAVPAATSTSTRPSSTAVLDTGVDLQHREYADRLADGFDFVDIIEGADTFMGNRLDADPDPSDPGVGHGSHVTGTAAARGCQRASHRTAGCCRCACWARCAGATR